jgi:23S rRNA (guanosine2251-2'-O)-methyltransferase
MEHLEGHRSVLAALSAYRRRFQVILVRHGARSPAVASVVELATRRGVPVRFVDAGELDAVAHGATHGGVLAICSPVPRTTVEELYEIVDRPLGVAPLLLLLEGVDDPRNLGFTLRTAEAVGVHAVLVKKHLWDLDPVEIARPASGAYERLPLVPFDDLHVLRRLQGKGLRVVGCLGGVKRTLYETDLTLPTVIAVGGEKRGLSGAVRGLCDAFLRIPMQSESSSLPLSHAAAIVMAEAIRQRMS